MANTLKTVLKKPLVSGFLSHFNHLRLPPIYFLDVRHLYSRATLGLDNFTQHREQVKLQMHNIADKFKEKMAEYVVSETKNMVFTEDLKNMVHLAETDKDIELAIEMLKRYNKQNKSLRFGNYIFGPIIMRMLYLYNKVDLALECFKSNELSGVFDQQISFQLLLDLLFVNERYQDMLEVFEEISKRQLEGHKYPKNVVVLALAACYKLNNKESLDFALQLWSKLAEVGHIPMRRAATFCAGLALNQGRPDVALEVLSSVHNQSYTTVRNLRVSALADLNRIDDVIPILKAVLTNDIPQDQAINHTFNFDVLEKLKKAIQQSDNPELTLEFNRLNQALEQQGHIIQKTLNEQLLEEIDRPPFNQQKSREFQYRSDNRQYKDKSHGDFQGRARDRRFTRRKPGLSELV